MPALVGSIRRKPSPPLSLPTRFGRYRLTRLLAVGGMAQIYLAKSFGAEGFVKPLVIKRLDPNLGTNPQLTSLFINEAKLLVSLNHGNIVPVFDFGRVDSDLYMAMEYVRGVTLRVLMEALKEQQEPLDHQLAAHIASEICKGLDYAHRKTDEQGRPAGIIHRDIKPKNILISQEGEVKIVDFGVAKLAGRVEHESHLTGTLAYMSPEQAERQAIDPRTDVFSAGLVLYEMLAGERAYGGSAPFEVLTMARKADIPTLPEDVPAELREVVHRAAHRELTMRYASAHEMEQALGEYLLLARSAGSTVDSVSPASKLAGLLRRLSPGKAEEPVDEADGSSVDIEPAPADTGQKMEDLSSLSSEPLDLELIHDAAETFHSEFMTRVLQEQQGEAPRRPWPVLGAAAVIALAAVAILVVALWPAQRTAVRGGPASDLAVSPARPDAGAVAEGAETTDGPRATRPRPRRRTPKRRYGFLHLNTIPWSRVTVDGRRLPQPTPVVGLKLRAGWHRIVLRNRELKLRKSIRVWIRAGATTRKLVRLR